MTLAGWLGPGGENPAIALLNLRGDRIDRSVQFAGAVEVRLRADHYVLVGEISARVRRLFERRIPAERLSVLGQAAPEEILQHGGHPFRVRGTPLTRRIT